MDYQLEDTARKTSFLKVLLVTGKEVSGALGALFPILIISV